MNIGMQEGIKKYVPNHQYFVGVDSDGTVFDTMGIKHKDVLIPIAIEVFQLNELRMEYTKIAEEINLYSKHRGVNRFIGLYMALEQLYSIDIFKDMVRVTYPIQELKGFITSELALSNAGLEEYQETIHSEFLDLVLSWSKQGDQLFARLSHGLPPFDHIKEALAAISQTSDTMIVSAATTQGLYTDWKDAELLEFMSLVAGQEFGGKSQQLSLAVDGKYENNHVLMIGDALGDRDAAKENNALFYPIIPGKEAKSWRRLLIESYKMFLEGTYAGEYEENLIKEFEGYCK